MSLGLVVLGPEQCCCAKPGDDYFVPNVSDFKHIRAWLKSLPQGSYLLCRGRDIKRTEPVDITAMYTDWDYGYAVLIDEEKILFVWDKFKIECFKIDGVNYKDLVHFVKASTNTQIPSLSLFRIKKITNPFTNYEINTQAIGNQLTVLMLSKNDLFGKLILTRSNDDLEITWGGVWKSYTNKKVALLNKVGKDECLNIEMLVDKNTFVLAINASMKLEQSMSNFMLTPQSAIIDATDNPSSSVAKEQPSEVLSVAVVGDTTQKLLQGPAKVQFTKLQNESFIQNVGAIITSFSKASETEKTKILNEITQYLTKEQKNPEQRKFGLACLRGIYSHGDVDIINRLWKECKNSFEVQPYSIIDIESLSLEDNELGRGTFGCVKKGTYQKISGETIPVAVKIIQENNLVFDLCDLRSEFIALTLLDHPNIINMFGGGFIKEDIGIHVSIHWFIVMDLMAGNLHQLIHGPLYSSFNFNNLLHFAIQISRGLAHLHSLKIIHRDIKPENILYGSDFTMKIGDLGIAKPTTDTMLRTAIGTHGYMAPELVGQTGAGVAFGPEVDIYALGILLWELFSGGTVQDFMQNNKQRFLSRTLVVPKVSNAPSWLNKLITKCCSTIPSKRPTASSILSTLEGQKCAMPPPKSGSQARPPTEYSWIQYSPAGNKQTLSPQQSEHLEMKYQSYLSRGISPVVFHFNAPYLVDFSEFTCTILTPDPFLIDKWALKRIRKSSGPNSTVKLSIGLVELNSKRYVQVRGLPEIDCSDIVDEVYFSYIDNNTLMPERTKKSAYPFEMPIDNLELYGGFICATPFFRDGAICPQILSLNISTAPNLFIPQPIEQPTRHLTNPFPPYVDGLFTSELIDTVQKICNKKIKLIINELSKPAVLETMSGSNGSGSIYTGIAGIGYFFWRVHHKLDDTNDHYLHLALKMCLSALKDPSLEEQTSTFLFGASGIHALLSVIYSELGEELLAKEHANKVIEECDVVESLDCYELLFGYAGIISSLLFLLENVPKQFYNVERVLQIVNNHCESIMKDGKVHYKMPNGKHYYGAAHGLAGILFTLMHNTHIIKDSKYRGAIESSLNELITKQADGLFRSLPNAWDSISPKVHWCHGSPGTIPALVKAHALFNNPEYLKIAELATEKVWECGILWKGLNLCHGVCGNAYSFVCMYNYTQNHKYLYYAYQFCVLANDPEIQCKFISYFDPQRKQLGTSDHPLSLFEGIAGEGCFYLDLLHPRGSQFPGYGWNSI